MIERFVIATYAALFGSSIGFYQEELSTKLKQTKEKLEIRNTVAR